MTRRKVETLNPDHVVDDYEDPTAGLATVADDDFADDTHNSEDDMPEEDDDDFADESDGAVTEVLDDDAGTEDTDDPNDPLYLRARAKRLRENAEENYWNLAETLSAIYLPALYQRWGFGSWKEYVDQELDFEIRKAQYLLNVWQWRQILPVKVRDEFAAMGPSKCRELSSVVTAENADTWLEKVRGRNYREITEMVRGVNKEDRERLDSMDTGAAADADEMRPKVQQKPVRVSFLMHRSGLDPLERGLTKAMDQALTDSREHALALICTEFLANNVNSNSPAEYLAGVELATGWRLVAVDPRSDTIVYGADLLAEVAATTGDASQADAIEGESVGSEADRAQACVAFEARWGVRMVAFDAQTPDVVFGTDTLVAVSEVVDEDEPSC